MKHSACIALLLLLASCSGREQFDYAPVMEYACFVEASDSSVVSISPFDGTRDTLLIDSPFTSVVCMSSSFAAGFAEIGVPQVVTAVSGVRFLSNSQLRATAVEVGSDAAPDYEAILALAPDVVLTYGVGNLAPAYEKKLSDLGIRSFRLYDHLEPTPLARAEYIKAYGAMCGARVAADSVFCAVRDRYIAVSESADTLLSQRGGRRIKVLINSPYGDAWYIPGADGYLSRLVSDAGGVLLGTRPGTESSVISLEEASVLARDADIWLHPGRGSRPSFVNINRIYDNTRRMTPAGGNDFWERGAVRPDLILSDLAIIFSGSESNFSCTESDSLYFYVKL